VLVSVCLALRLALRLSTGPGVDMLFFYSVFHPRRLASKARHYFKHKYFRSQNMFVVPLPGLLPIRLDHYIAAHLLIACHPVSFSEGSTPPRHLFFRDMLACTTPVMPTARGSDGECSPILRLTFPS